MRSRYPIAILFACVAGSIALGLGFVGCGSSSSTPATPAPDTGTDTGTAETTVKDTGTGDSSSDSPAEAADSAKPDTTPEAPEDTGPPPDEGTKLFPCGTETCNKTFQFCRESSTKKECVLYPSTCGFPSCVCLTTETTKGTPPTCKSSPAPTCAESDGAFTITCEPG